MDFTVISYIQLGIYNGMSLEHDHGAGTTTLRSIKIIQHSKKLPKSIK